MNDLNHLSKSAAQATLLPLEEKINYVRSPRWIGYSRAKVLLDRLEDLMTYPKKHRMPNLLIVGDTNNGKSMIINRFASKYPAYDCPDEEAIHVPVLLIESPPVPSEGRLYDKILSTLFAPYRINDKPEKKQREVINLIRKIGTRVIMLDEIHNLLAGSSSKQKEYLNVIKELGNELQIPIVGAGTKDALRAVNTDPQLGNRFEPFALQRWENNDEFLQLLASFEHMLPLRSPSDLTDEELAMKLLVMSEGLIGELSEILIRATVFALQNNKEKIGKTTLDSIGWISPSKRRKMSETTY
jgi:hypothetical protein